MSHSQHYSHLEALHLDPPCLPITRSAHPCFSGRLTAKAVAVLLPILGTSWVFGVLAVNSQAMVFQYMFAILNSLQVRAQWDCQPGSCQLCE